MECSRQKGSVGITQPNSCSLLGHLKLPWRPGQGQQEVLLGHSSTTLEGVEGPYSSLPKIPLKPIKNQTLSRGNIWKAPQKPLNFPSRDPFLVVYFKCVGFMGFLALWGGFGSSWNCDPAGGFSTGGLSHPEEEPSRKGKQW